MYVCVCVCVCVRVRVRFRMCVFLYGGLCVCVFARKLHINTLPVHQTVRGLQICTRASVHACNVMHRHNAKKSIHAQKFTIANRNILAHLPSAVQLFEGSRHG